MCPKNRDNTYLGESKRIKTYLNQLFKRIDEKKFDGKNSLEFNLIYEHITCQNLHEINYQCEIVTKYKRQQLLNLEAISTQNKLPTLNIQTQFFSKGTQLTTYCKNYFLLFCLHTRSAHKILFFY